MKWNFKQHCFKSRLMRHPLDPTIANLISQFTRPTRFCSWFDELSEFWNACRFMLLELCRFHLQFLRKLLVEKNQFQQSLPFPCAEVSEFRFANAIFRSQNCSSCHPAKLTKSLGQPWWSRLHQMHEIYDDSCSFTDVLYVFIVYFPFSKLCMDYAAILHIPGWDAAPADLHSQP